MYYVNKHLQFEVTPNGSQHSGVWGQGGLLATITDNCRYHSTVPARWYCFKCELKLCSACVVPGYRDAKTCPQCSAEVSSLGTSHIITPFWKRLHKYFLYPMKISVIGYMIFMTLILLFSTLVPYFGWLLQLLIMLGFMKYAYVVLGETALGHFTAPSLDWRISTEGMEMPLKQYAIFILVGVVIYQVGDNILSLIILLVTYFALPATAMIIATENSFFKAINPLVWGATIARIGVSYLVLYGFLILLSGSSYVIVSLFEGVLSGYVLGPLFVFITMYYTLVMFNMIGYVIYQYHEQLGFSVDVDYEETKEGSRKQIEAEQDPIIAQLNRLIIDGKTQEGLTYIESAIKSEPENLEYLDRYYKLLKLDGDPQRILKAGEKFIPMLVKLGRLSVALDLYRDCIHLDKQFTLKDPEAIATLARNAKLLHQPKLVVNLLNGFAKRFPKRADIPELYLLVAKSLCEELKQDAKAKQVLDNLIKMYPAHPAMAEIKQYHQVVSGLIAANPGQGSF